MLKTRNKTPLVLVSPARNMLNLEGAFFNFLKLFSAKLPVKKIFAKNIMLVFDFWANFVLCSGHEEFISLFPEKFNCQHDFALQCSCFAAQFCTNFI